MSRSGEFLLTTTESITLPLAHAHGVTTIKVEILAEIKFGGWAQNRHCKSIVCNTTFAEKYQYQCSVRHSDTHTYTMYLEGDGKLARPTGTTNHTQQTPLDSTPPTSGESKVGRINTIQIKSSVVNVPVRLH